MTTVIRNLDRFLTRHGIGETESYETAPYCGHHHERSRTPITHSHYHEGEGSTVLRLGPVWIHETNIEDVGTVPALRPSLARFTRRTRKAWAFFTAAVDAKVDAKLIAELSRDLWSTW